jgi:methionyl-tRNA formyltransferase
MKGATKLKILLLSPRPDSLIQALSSESVDFSNDDLQPDLLATKNYDFAISFGYRYLIPQECIEILQGNILNIHISLLPWNKGSDPNIWSWLENTPKGVSIHWVTDQPDAGDIAIQKAIALDENDTLHKTYEILQTEAAELFNKLWNDIGITNAKRSQQSGMGSIHKKSDLKKHQKVLTNGYDTQCIVLKNYGRENNLWLDSD